jgi:hypothetical protein
MSGRLPTGTIVIVSMFRAGAESCGTLNCTLAAPRTPREIALILGGQLEELAQALPEMLAPQFPIVITIHIVGADDIGFEVANVQFERVTRRAAAIAFVCKKVPAVIETAIAAAVAGASLALVQ